MYYTILYYSILSTHGFPHCPSKEDNTQVLIMMRGSCCHPKHKAAGKAKLHSSKSSSNIKHTQQSCRKLCSQTLEGMGREGGRPVSECFHPSSYRMPGAHRFSHCPSKEDNTQVLIMMRGSCCHPKTQGSWQWRSYPAASQVAAASTPNNPVGNCVPNLSSA